jgi:hypothetical protein
MNKIKICHDLAVKYAELVFLHPEKFKNEEIIQRIPSIQGITNLSANYAMCYNSALEWFYDNFETYITTKYLSEMDK